MRLVNNKRRNWRYHNGEIYKRCPHCGGWFKADRFYNQKAASGRLGKTAWCKLCLTRYRRMRYRMLAISKPGKEASR